MKKCSKVARQRVQNKSHRQLKTVIWRFRYFSLVLTFSSGMSHGDSISVLVITHEREARLENSTTRTFRKIEFPTRRRHLSQ